MRSLEVFGGSDRDVEWDDQLEAAQSHKSPAPSARSHEGHNLSCVSG